MFGQQRPYIRGLSSCGRFTGVRLRDVLKRVGVGEKAREVVFFGTDRKQEEPTFRQQTYKLEQQFGRSITLENAMKPDPLLAWNLSGEPLKRDQGALLRLIMPGWYGVCNIKWLPEIHLQEDRYRVISRRAGTARCAASVAPAKTTIRILSGWKRKSHA